MASTGRAAGKNKSAATGRSGPTKKRAQAPKRRREEEEEEEEEKDAAVEQRSRPRRGPKMSYKMEYDENELPREEEAEDDYQLPDDEDAGEDDEDEEEDSLSEDGELDIEEHDEFNIEEDDEGCEVLDNSALDRLLDEVPILDEVEDEDDPAAIDERGEESGGQGSQTYLRPDWYEQLQLGNVGYPKWFTELEDSVVDQTIETGYKLVEKMFAVRLSQAAQWSYDQYDLKCPFKRDVLAVLQQEHWTARRLTELFMSGKDRYRQYLTGLGRPPTAEEHDGIPRPTTEILRRAAVYCNRIVRPGIPESRYIGSATGKQGAGGRLVAYERVIRRSKSESKVPRDEERHLSQIVQPDAECHVRLYSHWNRERVNPMLVVIMEAASIDFDRTISDALPAWGSSWAGMHSREMLEASRLSFPHKEKGAFIGLNRASPYKQGCNTGVLAYRRQIYERHNATCTCCGQQRKERDTKENPMRRWRLADEICFPLESVSLLCYRCQVTWKTASDRSRDGATNFQKARRRKIEEAKARREPKSAPTAKKEKAVRRQWKKVRIPSPNRDRVAFRSTNSGKCCLCEQPAFLDAQGNIDGKVQSYACPLSGFEGQAWCIKCNNIYTNLGRPTEGEELDKFVRERPREAVRWLHQRALADTSECGYCEADLSNVPKVKTDSKARPEADPSTYIRICNACWLMLDRWLKKAAKEDRTFTDHDLQELIQKRKKKMSSK